MAKSPQSRSGPNGSKIAAVRVPGTPQASNSIDLGRNLKSQQGATMLPPISLNTAPTERNAGWGLFDSTFDSNRNQNGSGWQLPIDGSSMFRDQAGMRWSDHPVHKVEIPRHSLETLAEQMADPEKWAYMLREHARTMRKQLALLEKAQGKGRRPPGTS